MSVLFLERANIRQGLCARVRGTVTTALLSHLRQETSQPPMNHFYRDVQGLGNVAVSRHAQARAEEEGISQEAFDRALLSPLTPDVPDGSDILWRERDGIRLVILTNPTPNLGAKLVKTVYRVEAQAKAFK